jgi:hypothetical protein
MKEIKFKGEQRPEDRQIAAMLTQAACTLLLARTTEGAKKVTLPSCEMAVMETFDSLVQKLVPNVQVNLVGVTQKPPEKG